MAFDKRKILQNALAYTQQGKWDRAIAEYQSILKADPRDLTVCNNLGDLYARAGKTAEAIEQYLKLGELYRADGLSVKAIAVYKKIAKLDPARTEAYLACADLYWEQGLVGEAKIQMATVLEHYARSGETTKLIDAYKRLAQFDPTNSAVIARLADTMAREGMREAAAAEYGRAAQAAQAAGQAAEAKRLLQKGRDLSPGAAETNVALAERLIGEGKTSKAVDVLKTITTGEPGNVKAWRLLGEVQASREQAPEAILALQRAVALGVPEVEVARSLGRALLQAARETDAIALCRRVTDTGVAEGEPDAAIACCRDLLAAAPQLTALHVHLAATLQELGRSEEARAAFQALAAAQEAAGQIDAAVETYRRLLGLDPSDAAARDRLKALEPPAPVALEAPTPAPAQAEIVPPPEEPVGPPQAEALDASLSSLEDLGLSLGTEDAALLLEESSEPLSDAIPDLGPAVLDDRASGAVEIEDETSQNADWLTQELHAIDLEQAAPDAPAAEIEWAPGKPSLELEDISANLGGPPRSGLRGESELDPDASAALLAEESPLVSIPVVELSDSPAESGASLLDLPPVETGTGPIDRPEDDASSSQVAEQLAEADVYQKYGLEEKARERLLEVIRLSPENLTARRRLRAIYLDRRQARDACAETLGIARILRARGQEEAAAAEVREGLSLAPDHPELLQFLVESPHAEARPAGEPRPVLLSGPEQTPDQAVPPAQAPMGVSEARGAGAEGAPPPDVPLLLELELEEAVRALEPISEAGPIAGPAAVDTLPTGFQELLDDSQAEPVVVLDEPETGGDQAMTDDVAEAEFYLSQGMTEEARAVHRRMQVRNPGHPAVAALGEQIERASSAPAPPPPEAPEAAAASEPSAVEEPPSAEPTAPVAPVDTDSSPQEVVPQFSVTDAPPAETGTGFVNLGAELDEELVAAEQPASGSEGGPLVDGLLKELQKGVREHLDEKDYETHYNLGIAYKEMELYDEAIQEFRLTAREAKRALECADLAGLCYLAKGQPEQAIQDLLAGLAIEGHSAEAYHNLRYDLGTAFETVGDVPRALEQFEILQSEGARFLDVQTRVQALRSRLPRTPGPTTKDETPRRKKKISFI